VTPGEFWRRTIAWVRRRELERELTSELNAHAELLARDLEREGFSEDDARVEARRQVGSPLRAREASRDAWGFPALDAMLHDLRYAVRGLRRSAGFTATVVVTLALGIGANTTMFSIIDRLMFRPYPYMRAPNEVRRVYLRTTARGRTLTYATMPYTRYLDIARASRSFSQVASVSEWRLAVGTGQNTRVGHVDGVSASFFDLFDAPPLRGGYFNSAEDRTGHASPCSPTRSGNRSSADKTSSVSRCRSGSRSTPSSASLPKDSSEPRTTAPSPICSSRSRRSPRTSTRLTRGTISRRTRGIGRRSSFAGAPAYPTPR
jgi:hypothetical protein